MTKKNKSAIQRRLIPTYIFLIIVSFISVFPLYWMISAATNTTTDVSRGRILPGTYFMENFKQSLAEINNLAKEQMNPEMKMKIIKEVAKPYTTLLTYYDCAIDEIVTKLNILNKEYSLNSEQNPIDSIKSRVKSIDSIVEKAYRKNIPFTIEAIKENIRDIAGVRVICNFPEDVYKIRDGLLNQDDVTLIEEKDYIKKPKQNGYRSLHLIIETPIYLSNGKKNMIVEVQIRTIAQNFWAALEHQLRYKKNIDEKKSISLALKLLAEESASIDTKMELLKKRIYKDNKQ